MGKSVVSLRESYINKKLSTMSLNFVKTYDLDYDLEKGLTLRQLKDLIQNVCDDEDGEVEYDHFYYITLHIIQKLEESSEDYRIELSSLKSGIGRRFDLDLAKFNEIFKLDEEYGFLELCNE
ncbi:hypothetical protein N9043_00230 [bacterium]|nr:hypothetical protein [bacterium]